jgi:cysteine desulfurase
MIRVHKREYLDVAASMPVSSRAKKAYIKALSLYGNPSAVHEEGRLAKETLEKARLSIARGTGVKMDAIIFTSGATEGNNIALQGVLKKHHEKGQPYSSMHVLYGSGAHASTVETLNYLSHLGVAVEAIPFQDGALDMEWFERTLKKETTLVSVECIAGETGVFTNARDVKRIIDRKASSALLHVDASQAPLVELIERGHFGADLLVLDAQKVGGVRGIGVLVTSLRVSLSPILFGGGQEQGLRPGTVSPALATAFAEALSEVQKGREIFIQHASRERKYLIEGITSHIENVMVNEGKKNAPHILNISLPGRDSDYLVALLNEEGFAVSTKSACETLDDTGSRGVLALSGDEARAKSTLRISWGPHTSHGALARFLKTLIAKVAFIDRHTL